jgi:hypothetical protein
MLIKRGEGKGLECGHIGSGCGRERRTARVKKVPCRLGTVAAPRTHVRHLLNARIASWSNRVREI